MSKNKTEQIELSKIRIDGGTQPRTEIDYALVDEYAESIESLPAITVFYDGASYWLADGFHRYFAHKKANSELINCEVKSGSLREAVLFSVGANANHGKRRTNEDKRKAVITLLKDEEWGNWSDREIAKRCCVDNSTVSSIRKHLLNSNSSGQERKYTDSKGRITTMDTSNIGKKQTGYIAPQEEQGPDDLKFSEEIGDLFEAQEEQENKSYYDEIMDEGKKLKPDSSSIAFAVVDEVIEKLKTIPKRDTMRKTAFQDLIDWLNNN